MSERKALLTVDGLCRSFRYGKEELRAVDGVSFEIYEGEAFGLVGESGCGKTPTGRTVIGLYPPTRGQIFFRDELIAEAGKSKKRKSDARIQMIFQDPIASLDGRMTVRDIIAEGLVISGVRDRQVINERVYEMLSYVGLLPEHASRYPHEFSGGQRQRIGIARALIMKPELIIADEPVSALDVSVQAQIINLLSRLKKELGTAILFIAHDLSVVKYFCDRIGVMYMGKLLETASSKELFENPLHPYTRSLLSAIPYPDPRYDKARNWLIFDPGESKESFESGKMQEVCEGHFVLCTDEELERYIKIRE